MSVISSHVLDTALGLPARNLALYLDVLDENAPTDLGGDRWRALAAGVTDGEGRVRDLLGGVPLAAGTYRITFETAAYFQAAGRPVFYPRVAVEFIVGAPVEHHHVPLLLSPFGYSTYRGS